MIFPISFLYFVQVKNGWCLNVFKRQWVQNGIHQDQVGLVSPRTYMDYTYTPDRVPNPRQYRRCLENSFEGETLKRFQRKVYQLLLHKRFQPKTRKIVVYGDSNCGKTSLFQPIAAVIGPEGLVETTKEGKFSTQMLTSETEVILLEEWVTNAKGNSLQICKHFDTMC